MFTEADCGPDTDQPLDRAGDGSLDKHVRVLEHTVVEESTGGSHLGCVLADLEDTLVELGTLLVSQLTDLRDFPADVVGVPGSKGTDMALLAADCVLARKWIEAQ